MLPAAHELVHRVALFSCVCYLEQVYLPIYNSGVMEGSRVGLIPRIKPQSNHSQTAQFSLVVKGINTTTKKEVS